ncbi:helix-turn-helix domain-containing protein [Haladaptatus caseinilyticus]|uniref:helix-turn-helix domain-containing protein n=1 Tax=Haladaptatus caseinilyticus TaxID=2993314 RepID=UPI00224B4048|nr:helix-turn-helix domain-containing protein [Haladaptatus caseinilyticus]
MRSATVVLTWNEVQVHPIDELLAENETVIVEAIRYLSPVHDGMYVELLELRGDLDHARALLDHSPDAIEYDVVGSGGRGVAYLQCRTAGLVDELLSILHEHELVLDWPIRYIDVGSSRGIQLTVLGTNSAIRRAVSDLPDGITLRLERLGEYEPSAGELSSILTDRQLELFELAVREGYFEVPRETTHRELAEKLNLSTGTVSEHFQRIEAKLVAGYVD